MLRVQIKIMQEMTKNLNLTGFLTISCWFFFKKNPIDIDLKNKNTEKLIYL